MGKRGIPNQQFLDDRLDKSGECWMWTGPTTSKGYGQCSKVVYGQCLWLAHRLAWVLANGLPIPDDKLVLHSCDTPGCCTPAHLHLGTQLDNMAEMRERGRQPAYQGNNLKSSEDPYSKVNPSPGMARLIATYNRNKARRLAREETENETYCDTKGTDKSRIMGSSVPDDGHQSMGGQ